MWVGKGGVSVEAVVANYSNSVMEEGLTHFKRQNVSIQKKSYKVRRYRMSN